MMKKILFSALFLLFFNATFAQTENGFKLGLTVHPNFGWLKSDIANAENDGTKAGFSYGLMGDFLFQENYAFSTGLALTTINGKLSSSAGGVFMDTDGAEASETLKLQYLEIPAKIKLMTSQKNGLKFYGEFGLGNAFNVRAKGDVKTANESREKESIGKKIAFYRGSIIIGGGAEIATSGKTTILAGLSFDNGFTDINKGSGSLKSSYLGINVGVFF